MALNKVTADSIADGTVVASDIADGTITLAKLQSGVLPTATANSAASYANAAFATANTGTASGSYANSAFATANTASASGSYANSAFATANTASASGSYANSAFAAANSATATDATQNTNITSASTYANGAFAKANTAGVGTVTSVATGNGLTGGTITSSGTLSLDYYTGSTIGNTSYPIGSYVLVGCAGATNLADKNSTATLYTTNQNPHFQNNSGNSGSALSGTWRARGSQYVNANCIQWTIVLYQRTA